MLELVADVAAASGWDVGLAAINVVQTCFLAYLAFRARPLSSS